jgi:hypothetical protein
MASSDTDDEDLKLAVAMSMQQSRLKASNRPIANNETVDLTADAEDDDEDMRRAIALSLRERRTTNSPKRPVIERSSCISTSPDHVTNVETPDQPTGHSASPSATLVRPLGFSGIDRKAMEQERLARLGKRKRDPSPGQPSKQIANMIPTQNNQTSNVSSRRSQETKLQYPRGVIKRTFATKFPRTDDITIDEVLQADSVNIAVISSFMWDSEWLNKKLSPLNVRQIWVMNAKGQDVQQRWLREMKEAGIPNLKIHFPPMDGMIHSMHSKFMLLFGKDKLRVVIPTANMTPIDWGEVMNDWQPGVMENSVFLVDVPRRSDDVMGKKEDLTRFGKDLVYFMEKQQVGEKVIEGVLKFDFSQTAHLAFVHAM